MQPQQADTSKQLFVLQDEKLLKLKLPLQKVLGFCPMFENTFVVMAIKTLRYEAIIHYDAAGNVLKEKVFHDSNLYPYIIPSDREIYWIDEDRDCVCCWDLKEDKYEEFSFKFNNETADTREIFYFPDSKLICLAEWGRHDSNFFRLTYYKYPLTKDSEPLVEPFENDNVWNYEFTVRRANLQSKFVWWKPSMKEQIQFRTYQIVEKEGKFVGEYVQHKAVNNFKTGNAATELSVGCMWEMTPNKYFFVSITDVPHNETSYPQGLFVYDDNTKEFREAKFGFEGKYRFQYIHYYCFGKTAMIRSFDFEKGDPLETPVYYIDNENECIAARSSWKCCHLNKFTLPGYDGNMIVDAEYENADVNQINSKATKVVDTKEIIVDMLEQWVTNVVEEDLLEAVSNMVQLCK